MAAAGLALALIMSAACRGTETSRRDSIESVQFASAHDLGRPGAADPAQPTFTAAASASPSASASAFAMDFPPPDVAIIQPWKPGAGAMTGPLPAPGTPVYLNVPLQYQERTRWCWAASGSMVLNFIGRPATQCQQANERFRNVPDVPKDCCPPLRCDWSGYPLFTGVNFAIRQGNALSWDELTEQIRHGIPVAFTWNWVGGSEHMLVVIGFTVVNDRRWVFVHDPATGYRQLPFIPYDRFVDGSSYEHGRDYFIPNIASNPHVGS
jgi:hypothetical protein